MKIRRGDVLYVGLPTSDGRRLIRRPALVVQDPEVRVPFSTIIVAGITSRTEARGPTRIPIHLGSPEATQMGLRTDSLISLDNLATISTWEAWELVGRCPRMGEVDQVLRTLLSLG